MFTRHGVASPVRSKLRVWCKVRQPEQTVAVVWCKVHQPEQTVAVVNYTPTIHPGHKLDKVQSSAWLQSSGRAKRSMQPNH